MSIESFVRPFQLPDVAKGVRIEQPGQREIKRNLLQFGRAGSGKTLSGSSSLNVTYYCVKYVVEKKQPA